MQKIFVIEPLLPNDDKAEKTQEIIQLVYSAGAEFTDSKAFKINEINPASYIGSGRLADVKTAAEELNAELIVFDGDLSPAQTANMSEILGIEVVDRTTLILDIFAQNAKSAEGKLQVELAQLRYLYPRLKGKGTELSRLGGGIGTRGPGESKLETDRRHIRRKITYLENQLAELKERRKLQSERRQKNNALTVALVGYTNTGKSTLLNALTDSEVLCQDKLFATLDPTLRKLNLGEFGVLLADTVGFLKNIPTSLIEAFKSTLETACDADLTVVVCDAKGDWQTELKTTRAMLDELNSKSPEIIVFNKCEDMENFDLYPKDAIFISAKYKKGLDVLRSAIKDKLKENYCSVTVSVGFPDVSKFNKLCVYAEYVDVKYNENGAEGVIVVKNQLLSKFNDFKRHEL